MRSASARRRMARSLPARWATMNGVDISIESRVADRRPAFSQRTSTTEQRRDHHGGAAHDVERRSGSRSRPRRTPSRPASASANVRRSRLRLTRNSSIPSSRFQPGVEARHRRVLVDQRRRHDRAVRLASAASPCPAGRPGRAAAAPPGRRRRSRARGRRTAGSRCAAARYSPWPRWKSRKPPTISTGQCPQMYMALTASTSACSPSDERPAPRPPSSGRACARRARARSRCRWRRRPCPP